MINGCIHSAAPREAAASDRDRRLPPAVTFVPFLNTVAVILLQEVISVSAPSSSFVASKIREVLLWWSDLPAAARKRHAIRFTRCTSTFCPSCRFLFPIMPVFSRSFRSFPDSCTTSTGSVFDARAVFGYTALEARYLIRILAASKRHFSGLGTLCDLLSRARSGRKLNSWWRSDSVLSSVGWNSWINLDLLALLLDSLTYLFIVCTTRRWKPQSGGPKPLGFHFPLTGESTPRLR